MSTNTNISYYIYTHTKAYMKRTGTTIKIREPPQEKNKSPYKSP